jgi:sigma-B regulation protein RsbU (phosphoserine phosphatase)
MARDVRTAVHMGVVGEIKITRMVRRINRIICDQAPTGRFISMFYGEIDRLDQLIYTAAGHPALHLSGDTFRVLREGGPVLGIHPDAHYVRGGAVLRQGDLLCLYTDGLSEARSPSGDLFGDERVQELLVELRHRAAREIVQRIFAEVHRFTGGLKDDDQTMVVVKRKGGEPDSRTDPARSG